MKNCGGVGVVLRLVRRDRKGNKPKCPPETGTRNENEKREVTVSPRTGYRFGLAEGID